jgi:hypothetical protein
MSEPMTKTWRETICAYARWQVLARQPCLPVTVEAGAHLVLIELKLDIRAQKQSIARSRQPSAVGGARTRGQGASSTPMHGEGGGVMHEAGLVCGCYTPPPIHTHTHKNRADWQQRHTTLPVSAAYLP